MPEVAKVAEEEFEKELKDYCYDWHSYYNHHSDEVPEVCASWTVNQVAVARSAAAQFLKEKGYDISRNPELSPFLLREA